MKVKQRIKEKNRINKQHNKIAHKIIKPGSKRKNVLKK